MAPRNGRESEARARAQERFTDTRKREAEAVRERDTAQKAEAAKTARLRALRLAKEAADREALAKEAAEKPVTAQRKRTAATPRKAG